MFKSAKTINAKLLYLIVPAVLIATMVESFVDSYLDFEEEQTMVSEQWHNLASTQANVVSGYLWNFDLEAIESHLGSLIEFSEVYRAEVYDEKDNLIAKKEVADKILQTHRSYTLDIIYEDPFVNRKIGSL